MRKIDIGSSYCEDCKSKLNKENKARLKDKYANETTKNSRWQTLRKKIILRDKCCVMCLKNGYIEYRTLQVHHLVKRTDDPSLIYEPSNLITLCRNCHEIAEKMGVGQQRKLFNDNLNKEIDFERL